MKLTPTRARSHSSLPPAHYRLMAAAGEHDWYRYHHYHLSLISRAPWMYGVHEHVVSSVEVDVVKSLLSPPPLNGRKKRIRPTATAHHCLHCKGSTRDRCLYARFQGVSHRR